DAELVVISVPDGAINEVSGELSTAGVYRAGQIVAHASGARPLSELASAASHGATTLVVHPLQTFPDVDFAVEHLPGSALALTALDEAGFAIGERIAGDLGMH